MQPQQQEQEQRQEQRRNTGISPLRRQSAPPSVEMTFVMGAEREQATARTTATARAKTKYRDLSTAAAKCAAFGRDDVCYGGRKRTSNRKNNGKNKSWLGKCIHSHLSDDKTVAKMGHPGFVAGFRKDNGNSNSNGNSNDNSNDNSEMRGSSPSTSLRVRMTGVLG